MAALDNMLICDDQGTPTAGGAFLLSRPAPVDVCHRIDDWSVELRSGSCYILARHAALATYEEAWDGAFAAAQKALDVLSVTRAADLGISDASTHHATWWADSGTVVLRITAIATLSLGFEAVVQVSDGAGVLRPLPPAPLPTWDKSFRYFRLAQVTDDLCDAYRNLYLALEALLDSIAPQQTRVSGTGGSPQAGEGEGVWLRRALAAAGRLVNLADFAPLGSSDPLRDLFNDLYADTRTALFHAKGSRGFLLPQDASARGRLEESLARLGRLYRALAQKHLGAATRGGVVTVEGFRKLAKSWEPNFRILATDDRMPLDPANTAVNPGGGRVVALPTRPEPALDGPLLKSFLGAAPAADLAALECVSRIVSSFDGVHAVAVAAFEGKLTLDWVGRFEAHVGFRQRNASSPKTLYSM